MLDALEPVVEDSKEVFTVSDPSAYSVSSCDGVTQVNSSDSTAADPLDVCFLLAGEAVSSSSSFWKSTVLVS